MISGDDTPIYDGLVREYQENPPTTRFRHAGGILCHGCQFCLAQMHVTNNDSSDDWAGWFPEKSRG